MVAMVRSLGGGRAAPLTTYAALGCECVYLRLVAVAIDE